MQQFRRIATITVWTLAAFLGWFVGVYLGMLVLYAVATRFGRTAMASLVPEWVFLAILIGLLGVGPLAFSVCTLILGLRGKLPGTRTRPVERRQGFPIEPTRARD